MDLGLKGAKIIVTGGASHIGQAIVWTLAAEGASIAIIDSPPTLSIVLGVGVIDSWATPEAGPPQPQARAIPTATTHLCDGDMAAPSQRGVTGSRPGRWQW